MNHVCLLVITILFFAAAIEATFAGNWALVAYGLAAGVLQISVISMGK